MSATTAKKKKIRGGHKTHVKKLLGQIDAIIYDFEITKEAELLGLRDALKLKALVLTQLDDEILMEAADDEISDMIEMNENCQLQIQQKITEIDVLLRRAYEAEKEMKESAAKVVNVQSNFQPPARKKLTIKLPKYEIKKFTGDPKEYRPFWDAFKVAIHDNADLSKVEKFTYLQGYLTGDAEDSIRGLTSTDANYDEAVEILTQRYGNKQVIVSSHMRALTSLASVHDDKDTRKIRKLHDCIESNLRSLNALDVRPDGLLLVPLLLEKFPNAMNLRVSRRFESNTDVWNVDDMMKELRKELAARERCNI